MRIRTSGNKSKAIWDLVMEELGKQEKATKNIEINVNGINIQNSEDIVNVFNDYYTSIAQKILSGNPLSKNNEVNVNTVKCNSNSMFLTPTTEVEVVGIIKGLGNNKSTGIDDIPEYIIKKCYPKITALTYIINLSLLL
jgi:hypothetical protein